MPRPLRPGHTIPLVGIISRVSANLVNPAKHVAMKWLNRKGGDPETGFDKPCYASVDFTHILTARAGDLHPIEVDAEHSEKFIRSDKLQTVVAMVNAWNRRSSA